jgi:hypothetical protein
MPIALGKGRSAKWHLKKTKKELLEKWYQTPYLNNG